LSPWWRRSLSKFWFRLTTVVSATAIAFGMLIVNVLFETVGSVSDFENCGYVAGNPLATVGIFAGIAFFVCGIRVRYFHRKLDKAGMDPSGSWFIGFLGSAFYFVPGMINMMLEGHGKNISLKLMAFQAVITVACMLTAQIGTSFAIRKLQDAEFIKSMG